jgi:hypothetical protein
MPRPYWIFTPVVVIGVKFWRSCQVAGVSPKPVPSSLP